jgi:poly(hydroxyalkanoate) depolymerase family esterase
MPRWTPRSALAALLLALACLTPPTAAAQVTTGRIQGYDFLLYTPPGLAPDAPAPLLVVLHGCRQDAEQIRIGAGFDRVADEEGLRVLYPQTRPGPGNPLGCWRWWEVDDQRRGQGEPAAVVAMVEAVGRRVGVDPDRVYVAGLSSGGALAGTLGALYPDVFAAAGVHSGLPFASASTVACALSVMDDGGPDAEGRGTLAYHHQGPRHRLVPLIVIQGEEDETVDPANAAGLIEQYAQMNDLADDGDGGNDSVDADADATREGAEPGGHAYRVTDYHDAAGRVLLRRVDVAGLGHAWSGGDPRGSYTDPAGPSATRLMWDFFATRRLDPEALQRRPPATCREHYATNFLHFWWYHSLSSAEYACDPWGGGWRHGFGDAWAAGRCPRPTAP